MIELPKEMEELLHHGTDAIRQAKKVLAISHIDTDGISALSIIVTMLVRGSKDHYWRPIHQLNSETILEVVELVQEHRPDVVVFSDLGTGQIHLIEEHIIGKNGVEKVIILDHHLPPGKDSDRREDHDGSLIEINPTHHGLNGSYDVSGAGMSFLLAYYLDPSNIDLVELAIVGASGDLQDYYGKGFTGLNRMFVELGETHDAIRIDKDLTFFGINTRPLPFLLQYATDPYLPGITGDRDACYAFFEDLDVEMKTPEDNWRIWVDLRQDEKKRIIQKLIEHILASYEDPAKAKGIIGDVITLVNRPPRSTLRSAKEFSTLLNACGRNRRADVGVRICLGDPDATQEGKALLQQHRTNLATALRRIENDGFTETQGMYVVNDPETQDTIIGIVIGMAQGSMIIPWDKPVIGVSTNTSDDGPIVKISGRARKSVVNQGVNIKEVFSEAAELLNNEHNKLVAEAGGHPMAAGAFIHNSVLEQFLEIISDNFANTLI
ncbi:MAG: DHHA1 domain-containing protein [Candidatus Thorarchaeota archaeon]|jgi:RecJ-like exonuclease